MPAKYLPEIDDNPVGGSKWINGKFGLGESTGTADDITQLVTGFMSPGNMLTAAKTAIFVPALLATNAATAERATKVLRLGMDRQTVYNTTGLFEGMEANSPLKAVISDAGATFTTGNAGSIIRSNLNTYKTEVPHAFYSSLPEGEFKLSDVINHKELFDAAPWTKDIPINGRAAWNSGVSQITPGGKISVGQSNVLSQKGGTEAGADEAFMSVLLHEVGHTVDNAYGFARGGNPGMFVRNADKISIAKSRAYSAKDPESEKILAELLNTSHAHYLNIPGELSSSTVQHMRANLSDTTSPNILMEQLAKKTGTPITFAESYPNIKKLDDGEDIKNILAKYLTDFTPPYP